MAQDLDREIAVRNADHQARAFLSHIIIPLMRTAESRLNELPVAALVSERITPAASRCMLTVNVDEDQPAATLAFEARLGATEPQIRCTQGSGAPSILSDLEASAVEGIIDRFLNSVLQREPEEPCQPDASCMQARPQEVHNAPRAA
jgi:hypothetical protein